MPQPTPLPLVAVLNGPNLNLLGLGEAEPSGAATLDELEAMCAETAEAIGLAIDFRQTNGEGELISWVQECRGRAAGLVINPAGFATTSVALMDAVIAVGLPAIEVHLGNPFREERLRRPSHLSRAAMGIIYGLGMRGYALALTALAESIEEGA